MVGHDDHLEGGGEALLALAGDHDRRRLVGPVDRDLLGHVVGGRSGEPGRADQDHGLGREVDVLLVLGRVAGDRLVAELGELDAQLLGGDLVHAVADDRPVAPARREPLGRLGQRRPARHRAGHAVGQLAQREEDLVARIGRIDADLVGHGQRQQVAGRDLGVERLGRRDAHLHVAPVGGVEDAVGLVGQVAAPAVHDGDHPGAAGADEVDRAVGVGGGARLADRDDERVGHVGPEVEAGELGGEHGPHLERRIADGGDQRRREALAGHGGRALPDDQHPADRCRPAGRPSRRRATCRRAASRPARRRPRPACPGGSCGTRPAPRRSPSAGSAGSRRGRCLAS